MVDLGHEASLAAMSEPRPAIQKLRERKARHQQRGRLYRVVFAVLGILVVLLGLVLVPLPGPGWLVVALGVGMLALEFEPMERLLERILGRLEATSERLSPLAKVLLAVLAVAGVAAWIAATLLWEIPLAPG
jgi:uncharacterized protein (TIGR02611 family)